MDHEFYPVVELYFRKFVEYPFRYNYLQRSNIF